MAIDDDGYEGRFDGGGFDDELGDDDAPPAKKKKKVATSTKIVLVVAGWLLLTLFLIGEFSKDKTPTDTVSAQLDTVDGEVEFDDGGTPDIVDTEAEAGFDTDGDGFLSDAERTTAVEAYEAAVASGEVALGEPWNGVYEGSATSAEEARADAAVPGAGPTSGGTSGGTDSGPGGTSGGSTSATTAPSSSGPGSATTTTAVPGGGGGGGTTTTAKPSSGGGGGATTTTTTAAATTTTPPTTSPPAPTAGPPQTIEITKSGSDYVYTPRNFTVSPGTQVNMFNNTNVVHNWKVGDEPAEVLVKGMKTQYRVFNSTVDYRCTIHEEMTGRITVS